MKSKDWIFLAPCAVGGAILGTCLYIGYRMMYTPSETINKWPSDYGLLYEDVSFAASKEQGRQKVNVIWLVDTSSRRRHD